MLVWVPRIALLLPLLPFLVFRPAAPPPLVGDGAVIELYTRIAADGRQLLGPYSRFHVHHPGPLFFYLSVPLYLLLGASPRGIALTAGLLNGASLIGILVLARRDAGEVGQILAAVLLALFVAAREPAWLFSFWNPNVAVLPLGFALVAFAAFAGGRDGALPLGVLAASLAAETHLGTTAAAVAAGALAVGLRLAAVRRFAGLPPRPSPSRRILAGSGLLILVVWAPTAAEQLLPGGGNLGRLLSLARDLGGGHSLGQAAGALAGAATAFLTRALGGPPEGGSPWIALGLGIGLVLVHLRTRHEGSFASPLALVVLGAGGAGLFSLMGSAGRLLPHLVRWAAMVGVLALVAIGLALAGWARRTVPNREAWGTAAAGLGLLACLALGTVNTRSALRLARQPPQASPAALVVEGLAPAVLRRLGPGLGRLRVEVEPRVDRTVAVGLLLALDKGGLNLGVAPFGPFRLGGHLAIRGDERRVLVLGERHPDWEASGRAERLAERAGIAIYLRRDSLTWPGA